MRHWSNKIDTMNFLTEFKSALSSPMTVRIIVFALVFLLAMGGGWFAYYISQEEFFTPQISPDPTRWQAVFINNGQVYFGRLQRSQGDYTLLKNVYYLQVSQTLQPASSTTRSAFEIVKLGGELHGPEDEMYFLKSAILFWENMRPDSQVVQAINNFSGSLTQ